MGMLRSKWSGPFVISNVYPSGAIELEDHEKKKFMVNGQRLKNYYVAGPRATKVCLQEKTFREKLERVMPQIKARQKKLSEGVKYRSPKKLRKSQIPKLSMIVHGRVIAKGLPPWANGVRQIKRRNLSVQAKHWLGFMGNHLLPSRNDQDIAVDKDIIVGCIMDKIAINLGELTVEMIKFRANQPGNLLPFSTLISMVCLKFKVPLLPKINHRVICTGVIDITQCKDENNPTGLKRKALVLVDLGVEGLPSLEGVEIPLNSTLNAESHQDSTNTTLSLSTTPPPYSTQSARFSTVTFAKDASMTLANNVTLTRLVAYIPHFIQASIVPLRASVAKLEQRMATLKARGDCDRVASVRADLDSSRAEIHSKQHSFGLDKAKIAFPPETSGLVLPFDDLFREGQEKIDYEV
ncbi:hypothetical protein CQW23_19222 [Capsicum baccatum]|uniref:Putative plant transposon protein domain-containing protein n=1 Tax=Capsicum baccatum TaxID=33114 RepID=A0A2G2W571_CAPBA|nr:hypothetical protein CQW23_19222 [Capsicum baccatum]